MASWPPTLPELKDDLAIPAEVTEDDDALQRRLNAAVRFVQRVRADVFLTDDSGIPVEPVEFVNDRESDTIVLGTLMLAGRWHARRRSPDLVLYMAETGTTRVPDADGDVSRLLRVGRHAKPKVG